MSRDAVRAFIVVDVDLEFSGKAGPAIAIDSSPSQHHSRHRLIYSTSVKVVIPICDFLRNLYADMESKDSLPGAPKPRLVFTPSSLDNVATVLSQFSLSGDSSRALEPSIDYAPSFLAISMWSFTISITSKVVHKPSVSPLYHRILFSPYRFIRTNQPVSFPPRAFGPQITFWKSRTLLFILHVIRTTMQLKQLAIIFGLAIQISAKLAGHQCHFPLGRAVYIATAEPVCQDESCEDDEDCDLVEAEECFCDALSFVSYA